MNKLLLVFLAFFLAVPLQAEAQQVNLPAASDWQQASGVAVRLVSGVTAVGESDTLPLGLEIELKPGWKTYWRSPGTAGYAARLNWAGSDNVGPVETSWPAPQRFVYQGLQTFGYEGRVILPLRAKVLRPGQPVSLRANIDMMACEHLCVPFSFDVALDLPAGAGQASAFAQDIAEWQKLVPGEDTAADVSITGVTVDAANDALTVSVLADPPLSHPELFVEGVRDVQFGPPAEETAGELTVPVLGNKPTASLAGAAVTLTLVDGARRVERKLTVEEGVTLNSAPPNLFHKVGLAKALLAALIGGLILNLMPCVLPVLSLKLLAVISHGKSPPARVRASFLASAAGIVASFWALAAVAVFFKRAGEAVGWGVQFQHPAFLGSLVVILTLFAASLWGLIHIPLPRFLSDAITDRLPGPGEHDRTLAGNFITGAFATILATPCSAPFVGTAIGFALAGGAVDIFAVATAMGIGLALPFLLVAAFPQVANHLPKPGRWMNWLRGILGIALLVTAIWLASVLQAGENGKGAVGIAVSGSIFLILFVLWIRASIQRPIVLVKGIVSIALSLAVLQGVTAWEHAAAEREPPLSSLNWIAFDESVIPSLVASGKVVFVDVTAGWCLTCKTNKALVMEAEPTLGRLRAADVVTMQGDWTSPDPEISAYLKKFGRYGVPFNAVYGPAAPQGIVLPELLTADAVQKALGQARGTAPAP